jgi:hypothetical protein
MEASTPVEVTVSGSLGTVVAVDDDVDLQPVEMIAEAQIAIAAVIRMSRR